MQTRRFPLPSLVLAVVCSVPAQAHHSAAAFDTQIEATITGTVTEYSFRNPHVYMTLEVTKDDGTVVHTEVEAGAGSVIAPLGFTRDAVKTGDVVTIVGNPGRRDPDAVFLGKELYHQDGTYFPLHIRSRSLSTDNDAVASSIEGTWFSPNTSFFAFLGSSGKWPVTAKGREAMANVNPLATPQKDCLPLGEPAVMFYPVANKVEVLDDRVVMHVDWYDTVRTIWLDGREHPPASETFLHGHSVGHWEGEALVVDSTNFAPNAIGFTMGLPSGEGKHLQERYELSDDGKQMIYSGVMSDPEYLSGPVEWSGTWEYRPEMELANEQCDLETALKFLDD